MIWLLRFLPYARYAAPLFAGLWLGWWACGKLYKAKELAELERRIEVMQQESKIALDYEKRKAGRERVRYVEKPVYRDCVPDDNWLRDFNKAITEASEFNR